MDWHNLEIGTSWRRVSAKENGLFPDLFVSFLSLSCNHCGTPLCAISCPAKAITKLEDSGIVVVDRAKCLGKDKCKTVCRKVCPYSTPQFGPETDAKMQKCDLCLERWKENKKPICVEACPMEALDAGPLDVLMKKYGNTKEACGFVHSRKTLPSIIFRPKIPKTSE
jgi:anaerobic dimethyl sulfoxide reductase subunit B (iron-sulfur subunit)